MRISYDSEVDALYICFIETTVTKRNTWPKGSLLTIPRTAGLLG